MARKDDLTASVGRFLKKRETVVGACRATPRGSVATTSIMAGIGAAIGYTLATLVAEGALATALGAGIGAFSGIWAASGVSHNRMKRRNGLRAAVVTMVLTQRRLLLFRQSWLANRAVTLIREIPIDSITSIVVGRARLISPHPVTVALTDESVLEFEAAKIEKPDLLAEAFRETTGG